MEDDSGEKVDYYQPVADDRFLYCVLTVHRYRRETLTMRGMERVIESQVGSRFSLIEDERFGGESLDEEKETEYHFVDPTTGKRTSVTHQFKPFKRVVYHGDGSENNPFKFKIQLRYYIHFRISAGYETPEEPWVKSRNEAVEGRAIGNMTLHLMRQKLQCCGFNTHQRYFQKPSGRVWLHEEESFTNILLSSFLDQGTGSSKLPFRIYLIRSHFYCCEWTEGESQVRKSFFICPVKTETFCLAELRQMLEESVKHCSYRTSEGTVKHFVFVNGSTLVDVDECLENELRVVDVVHPSLQPKGTPGNPYQVKLRITEIRY